MSFKVFLLQMMILGFSAFTEGNAKYEEAELTVLNTKNETEFKHGQYVYVELKDGSRTIAKVVGRKSSSKYHVLEVNGSHRGVVHAKYMKALTKEEISQMVDTRRNH